MPITVMNPTTAAQREQLRAEHAARVGAHIERRDNTVRLRAIGPLDASDRYETLTLCVARINLDTARLPLNIADCHARDICKVPGLSTLTDRVARAMLADVDSFVALNP